ncbi:ArdC family protein [Kibdelosporangium persicum]|uniref:N-terminal domain-containing protein n=1 Tax=Kibdelosporangium persicum TaxID=2698649 RepID=A0ABX2FJD0_9PSEU|nr:ArdC family protein [Kibdelosporangium persicum]NRN70830.1 hypothetical protein [Kibdelosporangium persicum]
MASPVAGNRRTNYTPEQRAERDAADGAIRDKAAELLANPDAMAAMVARLMTTTSPKLLRYSMRNNAMLARQADDRGMTLTDVDSYRGWQERGRAVRKGERGLRIVAPKGTEPSDQAEQDKVNPSHDNHAGQNENEETRVRFRMVSVFDISQTDGIEDAEPVETETVNDPATVLHANLTEEIQRLGYTIATTDQANATVTVQGTTVTVPHTQPVPELARALAIVLNLPKADRPTPQTTRTNADTATTDAGTSMVTSTDPNASQPVRLPLGDDYGTATGTVRTEWTTGRVYFALRAPRVTGTWTVTIDDPADTERPTRVNVDYGEDDGRNLYGSLGRRRPHRPIINGIDIAGGTHGIPLSNPAELVRWHVNCDRPTGSYNSTRTPDKTTERMAAVLRAIVHHIADRPDLAELHHVAARLAAVSRTREEANKAAQLDQEITDLAAKRDRHNQRAEQLANLAADSDQLALFASN